MKADAKRSATGEAVRSLIGKSIRDPAVFSSLNPIVAAAGGFIPNFADPLAEAIEREKQAGVPINQIRLNQSGKLRNAQNPMGLAVTNTRDEPTGAIPNYAREGRGFGEGDAFTAIIAAQAVAGLATGFVEAESTLAKFVRGLTSGVTILGSLTLLQGPMSSLSESLKNFGSTGLSLTGRTVEAVGAYGGRREFAARSRLGGVAGAIGGALPGIGIGVSLVASVAPLIMELTKVKDQFTELSGELANLKFTDLANDINNARVSLVKSIQSEILRREQLNDAIKDFDIDVDTERTDSETFLQLGKTIEKAFGGPTRTSLGGASIGTALEGVDDNTRRLLGQAAAAGISKEDIQTILNESTNFSRVASFGQGASTNFFTIDQDKLLAALVAALEDNVQAVQDNTRERLANIQSGKSF